MAAAVLPGVPFSLALTIVARQAIEPLSYDDIEIDTGFAINF
jgi:hypothetical protein